MNAEEFEAQLAEYLGNELAPEARALFEAYLVQHPERQAEVDELRGTLTELERLQATPVVRVSGVGHPESVERAHHFSRMFTTLSKVAAILIFGILIGRWSVSSAPNTSPSESTTPTIVDAGADGIHPGWYELADRLGNSNASLAGMLRATARDLH